MKIYCLLQEAQKLILSAVHFLTCVFYCPGYGDVFLPVPIFLCVVRSWCLPSRASIKVDITSVVCLCAFWCRSNEGGLRSTQWISLSFPPLLLFVTFSALFLSILGEGKPGNIYVQRPGVLWGDSHVECWLRCVLYAVRLWHREWRCDQVMWWRVRCVFHVRCFFLFLLLCAILLRFGMKGVGD